MTGVQTCALPILVMRLNEHRMTGIDGMNVPLRHVTVLEEAHNILKRTSGESSVEGANVASKSVEMLSNAIAEMRTYGEGFIIADQSPSAVDISAIRNTNTKIIMRLPDETDRRLAGKSAALKDEQLDEIAKLPKGVAVVYQNDWLEPILCKVKKFSGKEIPYRRKERPVVEQDESQWFVAELLKLLLKGRVNEPLEIDVERIEETLSVVDISTKNKIGILRLLSEYKKFDKLSIWEDAQFGQLSELVVELLGTRNKVDRLVRESRDFDELSSSLYMLINERVAVVSDEICLAVSQCLMKVYSTGSGDDLSIYAAWRESVVKRGGLL